MKGSEDDGEKERKVKKENNNKLGMDEGRNVVEIIGNNRIR